MSIARQSRRKHIDGRCVLAVSVAVQPRLLNSAATKALAGNAGSDALSRDI
jgi:hypothetical protein